MVTKGAARYEARDQVIARAAAFTGLGSGIFATPRVECPGPVAERSKCELQYNFSCTCFETVFALGLNWRLTYFFSFFSLETQVAWACTIHRHATASSDGPIHTIQETTRQRNRDSQTGMTIRRFQARVSKVNYQ